MSIHVQHISKRFGSFVALGDVSLDFPTGELVALLGPSGCGKTTLLRIIAGLETADHGRVFLEGEDASAADVRERQVGFVFQHYALFRHMTVFENVAFGLRVKPRRWRLPEAQIRERVQRLLQLVQLDWLGERLPAQLSGGQRQRIALARALAVEPRVLLLDEPFGALDAKVRKELRRWLRKLHDELHVTSLFVTHDQDEALEVADRIVLMNRGHIEQIGTPAEVYGQPATPFAFDFLGPVNRFRGRLHDGRLQVGGSALRVAAACGEIAPNAEAVGFARPHEIDLAPADAPDAVPARIERVLSFGSTVRVELIALLGESSGADIHYEVELGHGTLREQNLRDGQPVGVRPLNLRVFERTATSA